MQQAAFSELTIKLPVNVAETIKAGEIIALLADKALSRAEYYRTRCSEMEQKYGTGHAEFRKKVEEAGKEIFSEWDDLLIWEGYHLACKEWTDKYEELTNCTV